VRFKLDENIGRRGLEFLRASGHDVMTVWDQDLQGVTDQRLFDVCAAEGRALITLDRDFGEVLRFPPETGRESSSWMSGLGRLSKPLSTG
jgi:predicted nuclease of predicted toxin-antitoxin system